MKQRSIRYFRHKKIISRLKKWGVGIRSYKWGGRSLAKDKFSGFFGMAAMILPSVSPVDRWTKPDSEAEKHGATFIPCDGGGILIPPGFNRPWRDILSFPIDYYFGNSDILPVAPIEPYAPSGNGAIEIVPDFITPFEMIPNYIPPSTEVLNKSKSKQ